MNYTEVYRRESFDFGIKILIASDRPISDDEGSEISRYAEQIHDLVIAETMRLNPDAAKAVARERQEIVGLFDAPIYVEPIPNGYCHSYCCKHRPWFLVTTARGRIKIGWRKRVISIEWEGSDIAGTADEIFPAENVTKEGRLIHAWGLEDARRYLRMLQGLEPPT